MKSLVALLMLTILVLTATSAANHFHVMAENSDSISQLAVDTISASVDCSDLDSKGIPHDHCVGCNDVSACAHLFTKSEANFEFKNVISLRDFCAFPASFYQSPSYQGLIRPPIAA